MHGLSGDHYRVHLGCKEYCEPHWPWRSRTSVTGEIGFVVWSTPSRREKDCNSGEENVEGNWESRCRP
ncbi:hypothetical protein TIFTF001_053273 [Ficus carica]|uniref:Uncharacterized protein n=1 Tax=Ficus carica TaxID=3494 RepID=A0AA88JFA8_FICCA|nr:hypothetical protein TIFTF001_053273 [Ficus carica]